MHHSITDQPFNMKIGMYMYFVVEKALRYPICCRSPPGGAIAYQLLHCSINLQVDNVVAKNDAHLALSPTFHYVSIESSL
ncbi:uncharacterized protein TNCV_1827541 [Trichonephila clavipes]|nr:uncharacterized protein TNCV_1827541 [Trichonephila clavipes]